MRRLWLGLACIMVSACGTVPRTSSGGLASPPHVSGVDASAASSVPQRPLLSTEVLPSVDRTGTIKADASLLQRPKMGSVVLSAISSGTAVKVLGTLGNAEGQWVSVGFNDMQGWIRVTEITQDP